MNETAGMVQVSLHVDNTPVVAYLSEASCRARFQSVRRDASFKDILMENHGLIDAAVVRRFAAGTRNIFVLRSGDL
jgi:hypothetical protein